MRGIPDARRVSVSSPSNRSFADLYETKLASVHGTYYVLAGLWPVIHLRSFAAVTGPKPEGWLVKAMGLLITAIGLTLLTGARTKERATTTMLGSTAALALGGVSLRYAAQRRISPVYFLDAGVHLVLASAWAAVLLIGRWRSGPLSPRTK